MLAQSHRKWIYISQQLLCSRLRELGEGRTFLLCAARLHKHATVQKKEGERRKIQSPPPLPDWDVYVSPERKDEAPLRSPDYLLRSAESVELLLLLQLRHFPTINRKTVGLREPPHSAPEEGRGRSSCTRRGTTKAEGMSKNQKEVKKIQSVYLQNLEKLNQGLKPDKKSWKPKEGEFAVQTAMEKLRPPPIGGKAAKGSAHTNRISRDLTCSICLDLFKQPVSLPCDHTFCQACIEGYWTGPRGPSQGGTGSCPQCRKIYPGQSYRPNRIVANIVESYCQGLEESGATAGPTEGSGGSGGVERVPAPVPRCSRHREELKLYCEEDQELVCLVCGLSQEHRNHSMVCVQEAEHKYRVSEDPVQSQRRETMSWSVS